MKLKHYQEKVLNELKDYLSALANAKIENLKRERRTKTSPFPTFICCLQHN